MHGSAFEKDCHPHVMMINAIDEQHFAFAQRAQQARNARDGWQLIFSCDDGAMGKLATSFGDESGEGAKDGRPTWIRARGDEDVAGAQPFKVAGMGDQASWAACDTWTNGAGF